MGQWIEKYSLLLFVLSYLFLCGTKVLADFMNFDILNYLYTYYSGHYEALIGFVCSIFLFLTFKNWNMKYSRFVNLVSRSTFAIYIIHQTPSFYRFMWNGVFHVDAAVENGNIIGYSLLVIGMIFAVCVCVDNIRLFMASKVVFKSRIYRMTCKRLLNFYGIEK